MCAMDSEISRIIPEKIDKIVKVQYDKKQFFVKFPKEMSDYLKVGKNSQCRLTIPIDPKGNNTFEIIKGKRRIKKKRGGFITKRNAKKKSKERS